MASEIQFKQPLSEIFMLYRSQLDAYNDTYERIVKINRDITIESKRLIFVLHRTSDSNHLNILKEAELEFIKIKKLWKQIALILSKEDPLRFIRAYTHGLQEYIEALSFFHYLENEKLITWEEVSSDLKFEDENKSYEVYVSQKDYISGLADLTGELMRLSINTVGQGNLDRCGKICLFLRDIHVGFSTIPNVAAKDMCSKFKVMRQSLLKVERACYTMNVRGSEIPKNYLKEILSANQYNPIDTIDNY